MRSWLRKHKTTELLLGMAFIAALTALVFFLGYRQ